MSRADAGYSWKLPLDILMEVMAFSQLEAATLMATCRLLYTLGPPYVLRHGVALRTKSQMGSFVSFMLADTSRLAYMRSLELGEKVFDPRLNIEFHGTGPSFSELLAHPASALHTLILHDMEKILACNPHSLTSISTLTSLKRLHVYGVGRAAIEALRTMRSQLVSATVSLYGPLGYTPALRGHSAFSDVFSTLQFSTDTLQELDLSLGTPVNPGRDVPVSFQFPHVHTLRTVLDTHFPQRILLRLFPNLQNLHLVPGLGSFDIAEDPNAVWFISALRDANRKIEPSSSLNLVECSGEVTSLYPLSAHLTVSKLRICGYLFQHELPFFRVVVAETRPIELEVSVHGLQVVNEVTAILRELEPRMLRVLTMNVSFRPGDGDQDWAEAFVCATIGPMLQLDSSLEVLVNVLSRRSIVLRAGNGVSAEEVMPGYHPVLESSSDEFLTNTQRPDWRSPRQEA